METRVALSLKANEMIHSLFIFLVGTIEHVNFSRQLLVSASGHSPALTPTHEVQMRSEVLEGKSSETSCLVKRLKRASYFILIPLFK